MQADMHARRVGTVLAVSAGAIRVALDIEAPHGIALGSGVPLRFPRVNGLVVIPGEEGALVGLVHSIAIVPSNFPKRTGLKDYGVVDLPFPARQMEVTPLGVLRATGYMADGTSGLVVDRGVLTPPSVGAVVLMPTERELRAILEGSSYGPRVAIGQAALARELTVRIDPDRIFGRHVAVLGNTGGGKSCTVAGLVRWSIEAARCVSDQPNSRFIIFDPNGEYRTVFDDLAEVRVFRAEPTEQGEEQLRVPAWLWNATEWSAFSEASRGVQRPLLFQALRNLRAGQAMPDEDSRKLAIQVRGYLGILAADLARGPAAYTGFPAMKNFGEVLQAMDATFTSHQPRFPDAPIKSCLDEVISHISNLLRDHLAQGKYWSAFSEPEVAELRERLEALDSELPDVDLETVASEDAPIPFDVAQITAHLEVLASGEYSSAQFVGSFGLRIRTMLGHLRMRSVVGPIADQTESLEQWLSGYLSNEEGPHPSVVVVDLSLVPSGLLHVVSAVIARVTFEALQRYRRARGEQLPTVLVVEEAHHFLHRRTDIDDPNEAAVLCRQTFETIAREGRKFGLGLVLSSQRPSEVSPTVLSQCNTFLLHRIVNDRDQELVRRLVPDNLGSMLDDLPILPTQHAILLGWATSVPLLLKVRDLLPDQRPSSDDPQFWATWTGAKATSIDWGHLAAEWRAGSP